MLHNDKVQKMVKTSPRRHAGNRGSKRSGNIDDRQHCRFMLSLQLPNRGAEGGT